LAGAECPRFGRVIAWVTLICSLGQQGPRQQAGTKQDISTHIYRVLRIRGGCCVGVPTILSKIISDSYISQNAVLVIFTERNKQAFAYFPFVFSFGDTLFRGNRASTNNF
jgi:hypothetical protein